MSGAGGAIGLAVTTTIAAARNASLLHSGHPLPAALTAGFHDAFAVTGGLALAAAGTLIRRRAPGACSRPAFVAPAIRAA